MIFKKYDKVRELIYQGVNWKYNLVHCLSDLKEIFGMKGVLEFLDEELARYDRYAIYKSSYLMRLVNIIEKMQKLNISRKIYRQLPLSYWNYIIRYVSAENVEDIVDFICRGGEMKTLVAEFKKGFILRYNLFTDEFEFAPGEESNAHPEG